MKDILAGIFFFIFGLCVAIFRIPLSHWTAIAQSKFWHLKPPNEFLYQISFLVMGIIFTILGILTMFKIIK